MTCEFYSNIIPVQNLQIKFRSRSMGWSLSLPFLPYGNRFRRQRRVMQRYFDAQAVDVFKPTQAERVQAFLGDLLQRPDDFREAIHR